MIQIAAPSPHPACIATMSPSTVGVGDFAQVLAGLPVMVGAAATTALPGAAAQGAATVDGNGLPSVSRAMLPEEYGTTALPSVSATAAGIVQPLLPREPGTDVDAPSPARGGGPGRPFARAFADSRFRATPAVSPDTSAMTVAAGDGDDDNSDDGMLADDAPLGQPGCWSEPVVLAPDPARIAFAPAVSAGRTGSAEPQARQTSTPAADRVAATGTGTVETAGDAGSAERITLTEPDATRTPATASSPNRPAAAGDRQPAAAISGSAASSATSTIVPGGQRSPAPVMARDEVPMSTSNASTAPSAATSPAIAPQPAPTQAIATATIATATPGSTGRRAAATASIRLPQEQQTASTTPSPQVGPAAPAARVFAAAITAAGRQDREPSVPAPSIRRGGGGGRSPAAGDGASLAGVLAAAGPLAVAAPPASERATLDLADRHWPAAMVDHIERLRDEIGQWADAGSTRIRVVPDALGGIDVSLRRHDDGAVQVTLSADQPATRVLLADAQPELTRLAESRGLRLVDGSAASGFAGNQAGDGQPRRPAAPATPAAPPSAPTSTLTDDDEPAAGRIA